MVIIMQITAFYFWIKPKSLCLLLMAKQVIPLLYLNEPDPFPKPDRTHFSFFLCETSFFKLKQTDSLYQGCVPDCYRKNYP
ncbi:hypothetical protein BpHYR1_000319 [Brachionus plicatilis]|uniref:Secreted protein n=1 Tax=Brachionus plicatilis TaxID=10195 RepID=A0A3M7SII4_BRAPC|nr:hypothetical protein BpHYR1_000319 [Brachionus plicatilis]